MNKTPEIVRGGVFPDKETFDRIYDECLDNAPQVPENVKAAYHTMDNAFWEYINAIDEHKFRYAYQCGYEAAVRQIGQAPAHLLKGGAAV